MAHVVRRPRTAPFTKLVRATTAAAASRPPQRPFIARCICMCAHSYIYTLSAPRERERERLADDRMHVQPQPTNRAPNEFHCGLCCHETNPADVPTRMGFKSSLYTIRLAPCACVRPLNWCSAFNSSSNPLRMEKYMAPKLCSLFYFDNSHSKHMLQWRLFQIIDN
jgi:hypothetical protein